MGASLHDITSEGLSQGTSPHPPTQVPESPPLPLPPLLLDPSLPPAGDSVAVTNQGVPCRGQLKIRKMESQMKMNDAATVTKGSTALPIKVRSWLRCEIPLHVSVQSLNSLGTANDIQTDERFTSSPCSASAHWMIYLAQITLRYRNQVRWCVF